MSTFTAQELADFYQQVADGGEIQVESIHPPKNQPAWGSTKHSPSLVSDPAMWRIKPKKKVVDLSVLIKSGIDCTFWDDEEEYSETRKLSHILYGSTYVDHQDTIWEAVRPRMNHVHAWQGGECPLPEGLLVRVYFRNANNKVGLATDFKDLWYLNAALDDNDIIAFEVLGLAEGWQWPFLILEVSDE